MVPIFAVVCCNMVPACPRRQQLRLHSMDGWTVLCERVLFELQRSAVSMDLQFVSGPTVLRDGFHNCAAQRNTWAEQVVAIYAKNLMFASKLPIQIT